MIRVDNSCQLLCLVLGTMKINGPYKKCWSPRAVRPLLFPVFSHTCNMPITQKGDFAKSRANHTERRFCKIFFFFFFFFCRPQYGGKFCQGSSRVYQLCNKQPCPADSLDFRALQCAEYNSKPFRGWFYKWKPYTKVEGERGPALGDRFWALIHPCALGKHHPM